MDIKCEKFYEEIAMNAVTDSIAKLLKYPFDFHGDTSIRDYLYSRLHVYGGEKLNVDDPRPGYSALLLQSEHYTRGKYMNTGRRGKGGRFDVALTLPPKSPNAIEDRFADIGIDAGTKPSSYSKKPPPLFQKRGWGSMGIQSASVKEVFGNRAELASRVIQIGGREECGKASQ